MSVARDISWAITLTFFPCVCTDHRIHVVLPVQTSQTLVAVRNFIKSRHYSPNRFYARVNKIRIVFRQPTPVLPKNLSMPTPHLPATHPIRPTSNPRMPPNSFGFDVAMTLIRPQP